MQLILAVIGILSNSCSEKDDILSDSELLSGSIYGLAIDAENTEPMRGVQVQLCTQTGSTLSSTVTYDDGHFEFADIPTGEYTVIISSKKYPDVSYDFSVQGGRTASLDIPLGLYTNPYMPIYLSYDYRDVYGYGNRFIINMNTPRIDQIQVIEKGVYYSENKNPMSTGKKASLNSSYGYLFEGKTTTMYYVQAYIKDSKGNTYLSEIIHITEEAASPKVSTIGVTKVNDSMAILEGEITHKGNPVYLERGFIVSTEFKTPTLSDTTGLSTTKIPVYGDELTFKTTIDIKANVVYYVRAYARNVGFVGYGNVVAIEDHAPVVKTGNATNVRYTTATISGEITDIGEPKFTQHGFIYSYDTEIPTLSDVGKNTTKIIVAGTDLTFSADLDNLRDGKKYYYRAYAISNKFTAYGEIKSFQTTESSDWSTVGNLMVQTSVLNASTSERYYTNWSTANQLCKSSRVGGYSDWRLPTAAEIELIASQDWLPIDLFYRTQFCFWTSSTGLTSGGKYIWYDASKKLFYYDQDDSAAHALALAVRTIK